MRIRKNHVYPVLAAAILAGAYLAFLNLPPAKLEFRDRTYPHGFRDLVLESGSTRLDPLFGLPAMGGADAKSKPDTPAVCEALFDDFGSPAVGGRESPVQIATFLDYRCPYCRKLADILTKVKVDNVRIVYKEWPILGPGSVLGARAALAADRQGKYLTFHLRLMNSRFIPTEGSIESMASDLGLHLPRLREDMKSDGTTFAIQRTSALASALGFIGTPAMVVGRTIVQGEITRDQLDRLIEDEMRPQSPKVCSTGPHRS